MGKFDYEARQAVKAAQWKEDNLAEMQELLKDIVQEDFDGQPCVYAEEIEPYFLNSLGHRPGYMLLQFYAGDDMEVDPGRWVVVYEDGEVEIMDHIEFHKMFLKS